MIFEKQPENPLQVQISFHKVLENLEIIAQSDVDYRSNYAKGLLKAAAKVPELRTGITSLDTIANNKQLIRNLLADLFPTMLTKNEIKAVTMPFQNFTFNYSERLQHILANAGPDFDINIRDFDDEEFYIFSCCMVLNYYYGYSFDFSRPLFYDIPDANGILHHYRILYNGDFLEILPNSNAVDITSSDVETLIDNYDKIDLWKAKFPPNSWQLKGFGIMTLFETTMESALSNLKTDLLSDITLDLLPYNFQNTFRSIFKIPDLRVGFTAFNADEDVFSTLLINQNIHSFILKEGEEAACKSVLTDCSFGILVSEKKYYAFSDTEKVLDGDDQELALHLLKQDIRSCILAPVVKNGKLLGILELASSKPKVLNSINANKLDIVMPYLVDRIDQYFSDISNEVDAIIQKEYTAIHSSVQWKFRDEAILHTADKNSKDLPFKEIVFKNVTPLYGQIDIKSSSTARNQAIVADLTTQISLLLGLFAGISSKVPLPLLQQHIFELEQYKSALDDSFSADSESTIQNFILDDIHPMLDHFKSSGEDTRQKIKSYFEALDPNSMMIYQARKDFDQSLSVINKKMASLLDKKQEVAQEFFPHYYERFKSDGVEHNLYIGASIAPKLLYSPMYVSNLRLWQLQAMCEMEREYAQLRQTLPYDLDVTSLVLVFSSPISIRFRMDEKRFDVDGTYNARYEVVKKRIDKSNIKGTQERITQQGKITIVYSHKHEETEYRKYIRLLQHKEILDESIEHFDVEDLQGVTGLKALRVGIVYSDEKTSDHFYTYQQLVAEFKN